MLRRLFIFDKRNEVLLMRRQGTSFFKDFYMLPAGHIEGNETLTDGLLREMKEETGLVFDKNDLKLVHLLNRNRGDREYIDAFFQVKNWQNEPKIMETQKCDDMD